MSIVRRLGVGVRSLGRAISGVIERNWGRKFRELSQRRSASLPPVRMEGLEERRMLSVYSASIYIPSSAAEGESLRVTFDASSDYGINYWSVDWGDGAGPQNISNWETYTSGGGVISHAFSDGAANYSITGVAYENPDGQNNVASATATASVSVEDVAPSQSLQTFSSADEGQVVSLSMEGITDPGSDTVTQWSVTWGDGGTDTLNINQQGWLPLQHTYADGPTNYTVISTVVNEDGSFSISWEASVNDVTPNFNFAASDEVAEGSTYTLYHSYDDPGDDSITSWNVDWGDSSGTTSLNSDGVLTHVYADGLNSYSWTAVAVDDEGHSYTFNDLVTVTDVAPQPVISGVDWILSGQSYTLHADPSSDPADELPLSWYVEWGDNSNDSVYNLTNRDVVDLSHLYGSTGEYTIQAWLYDDGGSGTFSADELVVCVASVAPSLALGGADNVNEGGTYSLYYSLYGITDEQVSNWRIDWGDQSIESSAQPDGEGYFTHAYGDNTYAGIHVTMTPTRGPAATADKAVAVDEVSPTWALNTPGETDEGSPILIYPSYSDPADAVSAWWVDWGDQSSTESYGPSAPWFSHLYAGDGPTSYDVTVRGVDDDNCTFADTSLWVTVNNVGPGFEIGAQPMTLPEGQSVTVSYYSYQDPGNDAIGSNWWVDWGDNSSEQFASSVSSASHAYADGDDTYTLRATLSDDEGGLSTRSLEVTVGNVPPSLSIGGSDRINRYGTYVLGASLDPDPGNDTINGWFVDWGDSTTTTQSATGERSRTFEHTYSDFGPYTIHAWASDEDSSYWAYNSQTLEVTGDLNLTASGAASASEGDLYSLSYQLTIGSSSQIGNWSIDWGDGQNDPNAQPENGWFSHVFADDGQYPILITLHTTYGDSVTADPVSIAVSDVAPTQTLQTITSVGEGQPMALTNGVLDPGDDTVTAWTITWGDGGTDTLNINQQGWLPLQHAYADGLTSYWVTSTIVNEDGSFSMSWEVTVNNVEPSFDVVGNQAVEGSSFTLIAYRIDPGDDTITGWSVDWNDGGSPESFSDGDTMFWAHMYDDGPTERTLTVTAANEDGTYTWYPVVAVAPLAASDVSASESSGDADVTWTDNSAMESGFRVERKQGNNGAWISLGDVDADITTYTDTTAVPGVKYTYRIKTIAGSTEADSYGTSSPLPMSGGMTEPPDTPPGDDCCCCCCGGGMLIRTSGGTPSAQTTKNPSYGGTVTQTIPVVSVNRGGFNLGLTLVVSTEPGYADPSLGSGVSIAQLPRLSIYNQGDTIAVISGSSAYQFDQTSSGTLAPRDFGKDTLTFDQTLRQYVFTTTTGQRFYFEGFGNEDYDPKYRGGLLRMVDENGHQLGVDRDTDGTPTGLDVDENPNDTVQGTGAVDFTQDQYGHLSGITTLDPVSGSPSAELPSAEIESDANGNPTHIEVLRTIGSTQVTLDEILLRYTSGGQLKMMLGSASLERARADGISDPGSASDSVLDDYADKYYEYNAQGQVSLARIQGAGCSACGGQGQTTYTYTTSANADGYNSWKHSIVEVWPDANQSLTYYNSHGQKMLGVTQSLGTAMPLSSITHSGTTATVTSNGHGYAVDDVVVIRGADEAPYDGVFTITAATSNTFSYVMASDPGADATLQSGAAAREVEAQWGDFTQFDAQGRAILQAQASALNLPANVTALEQYADLLHAQSGNLQYLRDSQGMIQTTQYYSTTTATSSSAGGVAGLVQWTKVQQGETGTATILSEQSYFARTIDGASTYPVASRTEYAGAGGTDARTTTYTPTWAANSLHITQQTISRPVVSTGHNGSGVAEIEKTGLDAYGNAAWEMDALGHVSYRQFDPQTGAVLKEIVDVDYSSLSGGEQAEYPAGWSTSIAGLHLTTTFEVDSQGRTTHVTDPNGNDTYTVYKDFTNDGAGNNLGAEVWVYSGWHETSTGSEQYITTGPIQISRQNLLGSYSETITLRPTAVASVTPAGAETIDASSILSLSRTHTSDGGQVDYVDSYSSMPGSYTTGTNTLGTEGIHFLRTTYGYEKMGRQAWTKSPDGTIHHTFYDARGQVVTQWAGTVDVPNADYDGVSGLDWRDFRAALGAGGTGSAPAGVNMLKVSQNIYDNGNSGGDGNLTQSRTVFGDGASDYYATDYQYDYRNRLTAQRGPDHVAVHYTLNNAGDTTLVQTFADSDEDFDTADSSQLRGKSEALYDEQGRVYRSIRYAVDPATGGIGNKLTSNTWYNPNGQTMKTQGPSGIFSKTVFDGAGRAIGSYLGYDADETAYADADDVAGDTILQQSKVIYDAGGRPIVSTSYARHETGDSSTGELQANTSFIQTAATFYDNADRAIASVNFGRDNGGTRYIFNSNGTIKDTDSDGIPDGAESIPGSYSDDYILGKVEYDDDARIVRTTDNKERVGETHYDLLGRTTKTIENYANGTVAETETDTDRTTEYLYDQQGRLAVMRAKNPKGSSNGVENQDTAYFYRSDVDRSLATEVLYPDSAEEDGIKSVSSLTRSGTTATASVTGHGFAAEDVILITGADQPEYNGYFTITAVTTDTFSFTISGSPATTATGTIRVYWSEATDSVKTTYDRLGRSTTVRDQRGVEHTYSFDSAGRLSADAVTDYPTGQEPGAASFDNSILRIARAYDDLGRLQTLTNYDAASAGNVVNEVKWTFDGWGNVIKSQQAHDGAVDGSTPDVEYTYSDGAVSGEARYVRLSKVTYPGGREVFYNYGTAGEADDLLSRVNNIAADSSGTTKYAEYSYLGDGTIVSVTHPAVNNGLTLSYGSSGTYGGWDRFGRVINQKWTNGAQTTTLDEYTYTYDRASNRLTRTNALNSALSESYSYDGLDRLIDANRNGSDLQSWNLDSLGNWSSFTDGGNTQTRTANEANEITGISGSWIDPVYDLAGNMTSGPKAGDETTELRFVYDAWNRLVKATDAGDVTIATYEYDGQNRRIQKTVAGQSTEHAFFNEGWQLIETRVGTNSNATDQYVWDIRYIDAPVVRFHDANADGDLADANDNTLYYTNDANMNVTGLVDAGNGTVVERSAYDSNGKSYIFDGSWNIQSSSLYSNRMGFAGYLFDAETGQSYARTRYTNFDLGWTQRDKAYFDSWNLYEYVGSNPVGRVDAFGLSDRFEWGVRAQLEVALDSTGSGPWYRFGIVGSAGWRTEHVQAKIDVTFFTYNGGLGSPRGGGDNCDVGISGTVNIGGGERDYPTPMSTIGVEAMSAIGNPFEHSVALTQSATFNRHIGEMQYQGAWSFSANRLSGYIYNDGRMWLPIPNILAHIFQPNDNAGTDYGRTGGGYVMWDFGEGKFARLSYDNFTGRMRRDPQGHRLTIPQAGTRAGYYDQDPCEREYNRAETSIAYIDTVGGFTLTLTYTGVAWMQNWIHDYSLGGPYPKFHYDVGAVGGSVSGFQLSPPFAR